MDVWFDGSGRGGLPALWVSAGVRLMEPPGTDACLLCR
jgi:hypothetical protein